MFVFAGMVATAEITTLMSAELLLMTEVVTVAALFPLFGSVVWLVEVAVLLIVYPAGVVPSTCTTNGKFTLVPLAIAGLVQMMLPVPPTAGVRQVHPAGGVID